MKKRKPCYRARYTPGKGWAVLINTLVPIYDEQGCLLTA